MRSLFGTLVRAAAIGTVVTTAGCWCPPGGGEPPVSHTIGGTVSGLDGTVLLQDNGGDDLSVVADGTFTFSTPVGEGGAYNVSVATDPVDQTCTATNGSGTALADVTDVLITCIDDVPTTYTIGGVVSGLSLPGLALTNNGADVLPVSADGPFTFSVPVAAGGPYLVTISTQPLGQECSVTNGSGTASANVTDVQVLCGSAVP